MQSGLLFKFQSFRKAYVRPINVGLSSTADAMHSPCTDHKRPPNSQDAVLIQHFLGTAGKRPGVDSLSKFTACLPGEAGLQQRLAVCILSETHRFASLP